THCRALALRQHQYLSFGGGEHFETAPGRPDALAADLYQPVQCVVISQRIMVEKGQALGACSQGVIHRPLHWRVTPASLLGVLGCRVLGVMDHQVSTGQELDMSLVLSVHRRCSSKSHRQAPRGGSVTYMGLVIDGIDHRDAVGLEAIPERKCRMVQV